MNKLSLMKYCFSILATVCALFAFTGCNEPITSAQGVLPDLVIEEVNIAAGKLPSDTFPYYEYIAAVKIKNLGGIVRSDDIYLNAGNDQLNMKVKNQEEELVLPADEMVEVAYQILKSDTEPKQFRLQIDAGTDEFTQNNGGAVSELDEKNNYFTIQVL